MQKRAPTLANILVIVLFALSCFGLLLFLWESFGGPVPLKPKGYRFTVELERTLALAEQSSVRISGVEVGHVIGLAAHSNGLNDVTVEMNHRYAPVRSNDRLILRQKTLLGETYLELLPQRGAAKPLPDGGQLASDQVEQAVTLDDILASLEPNVRASFKLWQRGLAASFNGRGEQINADFAEIEPFIEQAEQLVTILASQEGAVRDVVHNTGVVFDALTERDHQFEGLITNGERAFHSLALSSRQFADAFRELPAFERRSQTTLRELDNLATVGSPLLDQSRAWERQLAPLLQQVKAFTPDFNGLLTGIGPLTKASKRGLPAFEQTLGLLPPLLNQSEPVLRNLDPFLQFLGDYIPEVQSFFANVTAATNAHDKNNDLQNDAIQHYVRGLVTVTPESLAVYNQRIGTNRANPYLQPGGLRLLGSGGLQSFSTSSCANSAPAVSGPPNATISKEIIEQLRADHVVNTPASELAPGESEGNKVPAPACTQQGPFVWEGAASQYPHVTPPAPLK